MQVSTTEVSKGALTVAPNLLNAPHAVQVRGVTRDDYPILASFLASFQDETRGEGFWFRRFDLWWDKNPAFRESVPRGWILSENGTVHGFLGNVPSWVLLFGKPVIAFSTTTWRVLASHRNHSLRLLYEALRAAKGSILFDASPSDDAVRIVEGLKFQLLPGTPEKSVVVLNPELVLRARIQGKISSTVAARFGAPILAWLQCRRLKLTPRPDQMEVRALNVADSSFDDLWMRTQGLYAHTNVRSAAVINWQCFASEDFKKLLFGCYCSERLMGYIIALSRVRDRIRVLVCVDVWLDPRAPQALSELLYYICDWSRKRNVDLVDVPHYSRSLARTLSSLGLLQRKATSERRAYYKVPGSDPIDAVKSFYVGLQGDLGL